MKRRMSQLIGLLVGSLLLSTCSPPAPNTTLTSTLIPIKSSPTPFNSAAWQVWPAASSPQGVFDVARGEQFMWIATSFGVVRLDPVARAYTAYDQLGFVQRLFPIADDAVYASTAQGVYYFDGQVWSRITFTSTYPVLSNPVTAFGLDAQGDLWMLGYASRASRLYHLTGHVPLLDAPWPVATPDNLATPAPPAFPFQRPDCDEWPALATYTYGYRTLTECQRYLNAYTILERRGVLGPLAVERDGSFWWIISDHLLHVAVDGSILSTRSLPTSGRLAPDPQHGVWIATNDEGLLFATDSAVQHISIGLDKHTLFTPHDIAVDTEGTIWAATSRGVQRLSADGQQWQLVANSQWDPQVGSLPFRLLAAASGQGVWLSDGQELARYDGYNFAAAPPPPQGRELCLLTLIEPDQAGHVWAIGPGCSVLEFDPALQQWRQHLPDQHIYQLSIGTDDTVIALSDNGQLFAHPSDTVDWKVIAQVDLLSDPIVVADNRGGAWVGSRQKAEVWHYPNDSAQPIVLRLPEKKTFNLLVDRQSRLWLSTPDELTRYDGLAWQTVGAPPIGLISALATAPDGRLWFAGERGIAVYDPKLDAQP